MIPILIVVIGTIAFVAMAKYLNRRDDKRLARRLPPNQRHFFTGR
ncbi:MAG: hypothetical protein QG633_373 [Patescibacteria group bacterium]|jgi:hypothetical protein|nr:hypothetical protein [Patescibacteria group bacterium]